MGRTFSCLKEDISCLRGEKETTHELREGSEIKGNEEGKRGVPTSQLPPPTTSQSCSRFHRLSVSNSFFLLHHHQLEALDEQPTLVKHQPSFLTSAPSASCSAVLSRILARQLRYCRFLPQALYGLNGVVKFVSFAKALPTLLQELSGCACKLCKTCPAMSPRFARFWDVVGRGPLPRQFTFSILMHLG